MFHDDDDDDDDDDGIKAMDGLILFQFKDILLLTLGFYKRPDLAGRCSAKWI